MTDDRDVKENTWELFVKNVKPLKNQNHKIIPEMPKYDYKGNIIPQKKSSKVVLQPRIWQGEPSERWTNQHVQRLSLKEIKKKTIEARIDLHGHTRAEADSALQRFFNWAQTSNVHFVLVITGKGGVLNESTQDWFNQHPEFIVSFNTAQQKDGGHGAFYVHIRRMRK